MCLSPRRLIALTTVLTAAALPGAAHAQTPEPAPVAPAPAQITLGWEKLKPANRALGRDLRQSRAIQRVVDAVNALVTVPREIPIVFTDATDIGPAYLPDQKGQELGVIVFPGWFLKLSDDLLRRELRGVRGMGPKRTLRAATQFVVAHEIGHALVDRLDLPVTGKEEDAVDGFAAYMLTSDKRFGPMVPLAAAMLFDGLKTEDRKLGDGDFADEHSLPQQRTYQFVCWIYGSDPKRFKGIVGPDMLPRQRAQRCPAEYRQVRRSWDRLLAPHRKPAEPARR